MPKVPVYNRQATDAPLPNVGVSTGAPAASFGQGALPTKALQNYANEINQVLAVEKKNADQLRVLEARKKLGEFETHLLYNEETGAMTKQKKDALGMGDVVTDSYQKFVDHETEQLANEEQKTAYKKFAYTSQNNTNRQVQKHIYAERVKYDNELTDAVLYKKKENTLRNYLNSDAVAAGIVEQTDILKEYGERTGLPAEAIKELQEKQVSLNHKDIIIKYLTNEDDLAASSYFKGAKKNGWLTQKDTVALTSALEEGSTRGAAHRLAEKIMSKDLPYGESLDMVRDGAKNDKVKEKAYVLVKQFYADRRAAETQARETLYEGYINKVDANPGKSLDEIVTPDHMDLLTREQKTSLAKYHNAPVVSNTDSWLEFYELDPIDVSNMSAMDFRVKYWSKFNTGDRREAEKKRAKGVKDKEGNLNLTNPRSFNKMVTDAWLEYEGKSGKGVKSISKRDEFAAFTRQAEADLEFYEINEKGGKDKASPTEKQKVIDDLLVPITIEVPWWRDKVIPSGLIKENPSGDYWVPMEDATDFQQERAKALMAAKGIPKPYPWHLIEQLVAAGARGDEARLNALLNAATKQAPNPKVERKIQAESNILGLMREGSLR